jgi:hypothetical protein
VSKFEIAVGVVVAGDIDKLASLLREDPSLVRVRSERPHHATLLHYVSAKNDRPDGAVLIARHGAPATTRRRVHRPSGNPPPNVGSRRGYGFSAELG